MLIDFRYTYKDLLKRERKALDEAERVMNNAYNPYSEFFVGACLISDRDEFIAGANVENSAYGSTICAERSALVAANAKGIRTFRTIAIITRGQHFDSEEPAAPCGACRQMLYEAAQLSLTGGMDIILSNTKKDKIVRTTIGELLPMAFGPRDVGIEIEKYR